MIHPLSIIRLQYIVLCVSCQFKNNSPCTKKQILMISPGLQASFNSFMDGWMFGLFVSSQCILRSKLLFTSSKVARQVQVVLVAVSFKKSCIIKILLTIEALERDGIYPVHVSFVFSQPLIGYKCLVALVTHGPLE